jgi:hypothetical protein
VGDRPTTPAVGLEELFWTQFHWENSQIVTKCKYRAIETTVCAKYYYLYSNYAFACPSV